MNEYINIKDIADAKGLTSTRSIRLELNKPESKYISRKVNVNGGTSYEILFSSLEPELQQKLRECETKSTALVPLNYQAPVVTDKAQQTACHRMNIVKAALEHRKKYSTKKRADKEFIELYNTGLFLPKAYEFMGSISISTLRRYIQAYKKQQQIKNRLIKKVKQTFKTEEIPLLEIKPKAVDEIAPIIEEQQKTKKERKLTSREQQMNRPFFNSDYEKFEWLMSNGTTNQEDRKWLINYMRSDEYINLYGD